MEVLPGDMPYKGKYRSYPGIMEKKMETTIMGYTGVRSMGSLDHRAVPKAALMLDAKLQAQTQKPYLDKLIRIPKPHLLHPKSHNL